MTSLREAVRRIHSIAPYLHGDQEEQSDVLRWAAHNIVQAVLLMTGERVAENPGEEALYTECPACGALPGGACFSVPGHRLPPKERFHPERIEKARDDMFAFLGRRGWIQQQITAHPQHRAPTGEPGPSSEG